MSSNVASTAAGMLLKQQQQRGPTQLQNWTGNTPTKPANTPTQQQQLMKARLQQQQAQQLQLRKAKANINNYNFTTTTQSVLKKYAQYPPSLLFHVYENHYRVNNQDSNIIPKSPPMANSFIEHIIREESPAEDR